MAKVYQVVTYHEVHDQEKLAAYAALAGPAMIAAGAKFLARGIPLAVKEDGKMERTVVIEWESLAAAQAGYDSEGYQQALAKLDGAASREFRYIAAAE